MVNSTLQVYKQPLQGLLSLSTLKQQYSRVVILTPRIFSSV